MDHKQVYNRIIERAKSRGYGNKKYRIKGQTPEINTEVHHIIPKSIGGTNSKKNLVVLSLKEHYICHLLLTRIYEDNSMIKAFYAMTNRWKLSASMYDYYRGKYHDRLSEKAKKQWTDEARKKCSEAMKERWKDKEYANKVYAGVRKYVEENPEEVAKKTKLVHDYNKTDEGRKKMSDALKTRWEDDELKERYSKRMRELHKDPIEKEKRTKHFKNPKSEEHKRKIGIKSKEWMNRPEIKQKYSERVKGSKNPMAKKVINIKTKEIIGNAKELSVKLDMNYSTLKYYLTKQLLDKIDWMWYNDYVELEGR